MLSLSPIEANLEALLNQLQTGVVLYHPVFRGKEKAPIDFEVAFSNHQMDVFGNLPPGGLKGQRVLSMVNMDEEGRRTLFEQINEVYTTGRQTTTTLYNKILGRHFQQTRSKLGDGVLSEIKDITAELLERKERERQTALSDQILNQAINAWFSCEAVRNENGQVTDFRITRINPAFTRILGLSSEAVTGQSFLAVFPSARENGIFELNRLVLQNGEKHRRLLHYVADRLDAWYEVAMEKLEPDGILITFQDVSIVGKAPYGVIQYSAVRNGNGQVVDFIHKVFNQAALDMAGFSFDALSTNTARELCVLRKNMALFNRSVEVMNTGVSQKFEYYVAATDTWISFSIVRYADGVLMNFIDISERKSQEKKVAEKAGQLSRIMDASLNAIYSWKALRDESGAIVDMQYTMINKKYKQMLGKSEEDVIGKTALQLYPSLKGSSIFQRYVEVIETGEPVNFEDYFKGGGLDMWFEAGAAKMGEDEVVISFRDITGQKKAALQLEEQHRFLDSILSQSPSGIVVVRMIRDEAGVIRDGKVIMMNDAAERYTQYPKEIMLSKTSAEMEPHIRESPLYQRVLQMMEDGQPFGMQYRMEMTGRWVEMNVARIDSDHLVNLFSDVTEAKNFQLEQERMLHDLKRSNEALEEFARASSHDLKEPVRKVHFFVNRLKTELEGKLDAAQTSIFEKVEKAADRMRLLIDDLLEYSHLSTSPPQKETVDLNLKLRNVLNDLELTIAEKSANIVVAPLPTIHGYRRQLQQLFQNLIINALKYSKPGVTPEIRIHSKKLKGRHSGLPLPPEEGEKEFHLIEVEDNGIGFEPSDAERIFDVFTRLHGNTEYPGTGIGLSIVRKVAQNHGGYVVAHGEPGKGARFGALIPAS